MKPYLVTFCIYLLFPFAYQASSHVGALELDELNFDKITNKFEVSVVKFDIAFPYGDKHDAFVALVKDAKDVDDLLIAEVGVKDYGEKDNEQLAAKYGATKDNFPVVKMFVKGKSEPLTFDQSKGFTTDELRVFIRENTGIYLSLPGCVKELDILATEFMKAKKDDRNKVIEKVEKLKEELSSKDNASRKIYKTIMQKILEKGEDFVQSEFERVKKVLNSKVSDEKKNELSKRINILMSFQFHGKQSKAKKAEL